jgi:hypothetical protein
MNYSSLPPRWKTELVKAMTDIDTDRLKDEKAIRQGLTFITAPTLPNKNRPTGENVVLVRFSEKWPK